MQNRACRRTRTRKRKRKSKRKRKNDDQIPYNPNPHAVGRFPGPTNMYNLIDTSHALSLNTTPANKSLPQRLINHQPRWPYIISSLFPGQAWMGWIVGCTHACTHGYGRGYLLSRRAANQRPQKTLTRSSGLKLIKFNPIQYKPPPSPRRGKADHHSTVRVDTGTSCLKTTSPSYTLF